jgi:hypothetical protein
LTRPAAASVQRLSDEGTTLAIDVPVRCGGSPEPISSPDTDGDLDMTDTHTLDQDRTVDTYESTCTGEGDRPAAADAVRSAPIVAALERAWDEIRSCHPHLPRVVIGSGVRVRWRTSWLVEARAFRGDAVADR